MDETKNLSETEGTKPPGEGSSGSPDETKNLSETEGTQPPVEGSSGSPKGDPSRIGRYRIIHRLGQGGFGRVYLAHDDDLDRPVAIKAVRSGSLCGRRCLMLLLTCLFENPMSRRMVAEYARLHLLMPTTAGAGCFPPAIAPRAWQSLPHALAQLGRCRYLAQQREQRIHLDQFADCHHLPLHVVEQLLVGNLLRLTFLVRRQVGAHDLQRVVQQQAERHLKQYRLRHRADQMPQREHVGDLVENRFDSPAALIRRQHRLGRILHLIQQVRDHTDLFAVTQMLGDPTHVLTASLLNLAQPTPLLNDPVPFGVAALPGRPGRIGDERRIGAVADEEMAPGFQHLLRETQVAVKSVQQSGSGSTAGISGRTAFILWVPSSSRVSLTARGRFPSLS